jgi:hypothetical protein
MLGASSKDSCAEERSASAGALWVLLPSVLTLSLPELLVLVLVLSGLAVRSAMAGTC